jgi:hypothetical protein
MVTPDSGNRVVPGGRWALDNGCFSQRWTPDRWRAELGRHQETPGCLFAVVPDVVADAAATDALWLAWAATVAGLGYRPAYVGQNGCTGIPADAGAFFLGGDTEWKLGPEARILAGEAKRRGLWLHCGRVNSLRRLRYAADLGCDSVDGTFLAFAPDHNIARLLPWIRPEQPSLFGGVA